MVSELGVLVHNSCVNNSTPWIELGEGMDFGARPTGVDYVYIIRDKASGVFLKVGETKDIATRMAAYRNAGNKAMMQLEAKISSVPSVQRQQIETTVRNALEARGFRLPWDNTGRRLGYQGQAKMFSLELLAELGIW